MKHSVHLYFDIFLIVGSSIKTVNNEGQLYTEYLKMKIFYPIFLHNLTEVVQNSFFPNFEKSSDSWFKRNLVLEGPRYDRARELSAGLEKEMINLSG